MRIDSRSKVLLSQQIKSDICARIRSGEIQLEERLPPERQLAKNYGVSRMTARHALVELCNEKILYRIHGKGTYVANLPGVEDSGDRADDRSIAVVVPSLRISVFFQIIDGIHDSLVRTGYKLLLRSANDDPLQEREALLDVRGDSIRGLILVAGQNYSCANADLLGNIVKRIPVVVMNAAIPGLESDRVIADNRQGAFLATTHLIELGHRKVAHLTAAQDWLDGYQDALADHHIEYNPDLVRSTHWKFDEGYYETKKLLMNNPDVTAIFACNDVVVTGAMNALKELGIAVPDNVALVGYGNLDFGRFLEVPLTTVDQSPDEMGKTAARLLIDKISGRRGFEDTEEVRFPTKLVIRRSCGIHGSFQVSA